MAVTALPAGVYPASVTPLDPAGKIDGPSLLRLLAHFEASGCSGVVLAGTNGEGPSLSSFEKRDLLRIARKSQGQLRLILGVATPSIDEAQWLCTQAGKDGADAVLLMPPGYFRSVQETGIIEWFLRVLDDSPLPILIYNYPKMTGVTLSESMVKTIAEHPNLIGLKDSSGEAKNLASYRAVLKPHQCLFVGDETLLMDALAAGWSGTISGAANSLPNWLARIVSLWSDGNKDSAKSVFDFVAPLLQSIRTLSQPATNKSILHSFGLISERTLKLPLQEVEVEYFIAILKAKLGSC